MNDLVRHEGWEHAAANDLEILCDELRGLPEIKAKMAIKHAAKYTSTAVSPGIAFITEDDRQYAMPGDDAAAFKTAGGYQLFAMEGMLPQFVKLDPAAAGWSSVMVNVSDIAAMGGRATAIVNAFWHDDAQKSAELLHHIKRACDVFGLVFAGGHSSIQAGFTPGLAVAIIGEAQKLLSCHHIKPGQRLFMLTDLSGSWHGDLPYWGCVRGKSDEEIRQQWQVPAELAEAELCVAAKDISNGGILGTLIMMLELSGCGATVDLNAIPRPRGQLVRWMRAFQSFGFLLAVDQEKISAMLSYFNQSHLSCAPIGSIDDTGVIQVGMSGTNAEFWNLKKTPLTFLGERNAVSKL